MIIDQLPLLGGDVQGTDEFPIERGTTTYKTTQAALIKTATDAAAAAQAAADDAQLAADNAQDTADNANAKGLPPGGTAGQVLTKADSSDYSASWEDPSGGDVTANMLGIVINGNSTPVGASVGQYVIVKNSTISGITDGLYKAAQAIPANTVIDSAYLTAANGGGLNDLLKSENVTSQIYNINSNLVNTVSAFRVGKLIQINIQGQMASQPADSTFLFKIRPSISAPYFLMPAMSSGGSIIGALEASGGGILIRNPQYGSAPQRLLVSILYISEV